MMLVRTKLAALALSVALISGGALCAQENKPEGNPSPDEMHKQLAKLAGDWTFTNKMWMAPGQPPAEWTGTMHAETILGGRFVQSIWKGSFMGQEFEGRGTEGYDNATKQFVSSWVDNMGSGIVLSTGTCEDGGKKCTATRSSSDPRTGEPSTIRSVTTWVDDNTFKNEVYGKDPASGQEHKMMEIVAKRK